MEYPSSVPAGVSCFACGWIAHVVPSGPGSCRNCFPYRSYVCEVVVRCGRIAKVMVTMTGCRPCIRGVYGVALSRAVGQICVLGQTRYGSFVL